MDDKGFKDTIRWYDAHAETYAAAIEKYSPPDLREFVDLLPKNAKVLDAGCSGGRDTRLLREAGLDATGIDLSSGSVEVAKKKHPDIDFVQGNFLDLPFEDKAFDGIWAHASLLHFETIDDVKKSLSEFNRVLKPGGIMYVLVKAQTGDKKTEVVTDSPSQHDRFFRYFTQEELNDLLSEGGFEGIRKEQYKETDKNPKGRPEVEWISSLSKKN